MQEVWSRSIPPPFSPLGHGTGRWRYSGTRALHVAWHAQLWGYNSFYESVWSAVGSVKIFMMETFQSNLCRCRSLVDHKNCYTAPASESQFVLVKQKQSWRATAPEHGPESYHCYSASGNPLRLRNNRAPDYRSHGRWARILSYNRDKKVNASTLYRPGALWKGLHLFSYPLHWKMMLAIVFGTEK